MSDSYFLSSAGARGQRGLTTREGIGWIVSVTLVYCTLATWPVLGAVCHQVVSMRERTQKTNDFSESAGHCRTPGEASFAPEAHATRGTHFSERPRIAEPASVTSTWCTKPQVTIAAGVITMMTRGRWWWDGLLSQSWLLRCGPPGAVALSLLVGGFDAKNVAVATRFLRTVVFYVRRFPLRL